MHDLVLGSLAVAFIALSHQPKDAWTEDLRGAAHRTLETFRHYVEQKSDGIRFAGQVAVEETEKRLIITPRAMKSIAGSMQELMNHDRLPPLVEASQFTSLVRGLRDVCDGESAFSEALDIFVTIPVLHGVQPAPRLPMISEKNLIKETPHVQVDIVPPLMQRDDEVDGTHEMGSIGIGSKVRKLVLR